MTKSQTAGIRVRRWVTGHLIPIKAVCICHYGLMILTGWLLDSNPAVLQSCQSLIDFKSDSSGCKGLTIFASHWDYYNNHPINLLNPTSRRDCICEGIFLKLSRHISWLQWQKYSAVLLIKWSWVYSLHWIQIEETF